MYFKNIKNLQTLLLNIKSLKIHASRFIKAAFSIIIILSFIAASVFIPADNGNELYASSKIKVFLDPGHGGADPGAVWYSYQEKVPNLDIALRVKSKLEASGFEVVMSRKSDTGRTLDEIVAAANSSNADIFVSIHNNASLSPYAHGTETYWCANGVAGSNQLANLIQSNLVSYGGRANRGVKTANFRVIKYTKMPAALVECVFMSNQTESDLLKTESFREKLANGIYRGIAKFAEGINKSSPDDDKTDTTDKSDDKNNNKNTYSDLSKANSSGFTIKIKLPENNAKVFSQFELRGWAADLRGDPPKKLSKIKVYIVPERNKENLLGTVVDFSNNVMGSQGVLKSGFSLNIDINKLSEGENILYIYAFDENNKFSISNVKVIAVKKGDVSKINKNPVAVPGGPYKGKTGADVKFSGMGSYDPDGVISEYTWDFGDGSEILFGDAIVAGKPIHKYTKSGEYTAVLKVKDAFGKVSASVSTAVKIVDPGDSSDSSDTTQDTGNDLESISNKTSFVGYIDISADSLVKIFKDRNSTKIKRATRLAPLYIKYAKLFNMRADIAWAQMCHETGFLEFTGDVKPDQNNFCGMGATGGGVPGNSFGTEELGVIAHFAHLAWYYYPDHVNKYCSKTYDPRHFGNGHINYTGNKKLGFLNGRWAPGSTYTDKIILFTNQIIQGINTSKDNEPAYKISAEAGPDQSGNVGGKLIFDASESIIKVGTNDTISYSWDWNGDGIYDKTTENAVVKHTFEKFGVFEVKLKIKSLSGLKSTDTLKVTVNSIPVADPGGPYSGIIDEEIKFDGSKSKDTDGKIIKYLWDFGDGKTAEGMTPVHAYKKPGVYSVKLTVVDDRNTSSTTVKVSATITAGSNDGTLQSDSSSTDNSLSTDTSNQSDDTGSDTSETTETTETETLTEANLAPVANPGGPYTAKVKKSITFDGSQSADTNGTIIKYIWDFGDGTTANGQKPSHSYSKAGTYTVKLIVKDDGGLKSDAVTTTAKIEADSASEQYQTNTDIITNSTNFVGYTEVTPEQLVNIFIKRGSGKVEQAKRIAPIYIKYAKLFNMRADIAWAQMCHETGFLEYSGDVKPNQNNFCGLGATGGGVPGCSFATEELGIIAHYVHLAWYYYPDHINNYCSSNYDPRHFGGTHSKYAGNLTVGFLNGTWAPGATYTDKILLFSNQIYEN